MKLRTTEQLGTAVRVRRRDLGVSQKDLAMACGTGLRFIVDVEKGKPTCQSGKVLQVLQTLGIDLDIGWPGGAKPGDDKP
jgi:y4mF family transcriptional regulator